MAGFYGGDTEQMRMHGAASQRGAQRIADITAAMGASIDSVLWQGPDAEAFRALWHSSVKPGMLARAEEVRATGQELDQHAEQQEQASGDEGGGLLSTLRDIARDIFGPGGVTGPLLGRPLSRDLLDTLRGGLGDWSRGGGAGGPQEFYGGEGYASPGQAAGADRPVGNLLDLGGDLLEGREIDGDFGHLDVTAQGAWSAGANGSTDPFGNMSGTIGLRGGMELGADARLNGPDGTGIETSSQIGMEAYAEAGGTIGPDGLALGASAGSGVYASNTATLDGGDHGSLTYGHTAFAGADASANAWSHATRNEDGDVNGWTVGADARAFAGAELKHTFAAEAPGGWGFVEGSASALGGGGIGGGYGATLSTDEVSISLSGTVAKGLGLEGSGTIGINPNAIVDSFTPGDYDLDDMISDGADLVDRGKDWLSDINPF